MECGLGRQATARADGAAPSGRAPCGHAGGASRRCDVRFACCHVIYVAQGIDGTGGLAGGVAGGAGIATGVCGDRLGYPNRAAIRGKEASDVVHKKTDRRGPCAAAAYCPAVKGLEWGPAKGVVGHAFCLFCNYVDHAARPAIHRVRMAIAVFGRAGENPPEGGLVGAKQDQRAVVIVQAIALQDRAMAHGHQAHICKAR